MKLPRILGVLILAARALILIAAQSSNQTAGQGAANEAARLNNIGVAYMNQQLFEKGLKAFEDASARDPNLLVARMNRGIALLNLQRVDEAKTFLKEATEKDPKNPHGWYNLALLYKNSGDPQSAVEGFKRASEIDPNDADTWYMLGSVYLQLKQFPAAIESYEHALKLNPLDASAEFGMSRALQQSGNTAEARKHLTRFQYITQNKLGATMSLTYGEQGQYSRAEEVASVPHQVPPAIKVRFLDVTQQAGLATKGAINQPSDLGAGACALDFDDDGKVDLFVAGQGKDGSVALYHNLGNGKFEDVTRKAGLDPTMRAMGCTAGDYDNDGQTDLAVSLKGRVLLLHNEKNGTFKDVTEAAGIKSDGLNLGVTFVDYDHDGDLDLYVTGYAPEGSATGSAASGPKPAGKNTMWRNNGNGSFTDVTEQVALGGNAPGVAAVGTDYNNDRAVDLLLTSYGKGPVMFENPREGKFSAREPWSAPMPASAAGIAVLDFNHDGWMDVAFTHTGAPGLTLWRNNQGKSFDPVQLPIPKWLRGWGVAALDYDNDGWIDLAALGETKDGSGEIRVFRNVGPDGFKDVTTELGLDKLELRDPRSLIAGDFDGDGATDLLITQNHGSLVLLRNEGATQNHWLRVSLKGLNDNKSAIGTKVEVFAGANRQKWEIAGSTGYLGRSSSEIIVGLGQAKSADVVRMLWPTGVLQDEIEVASDRTQNYLESDRRGISCPTLFAWDGKHYELVADVLGAGVIGHWVGDGQRNIPRPTEYVKIDQRGIRAKDGRLRFRLMEPMEEVVYLDRVGLLAVDHPSNIEVNPNEYFASNPPYPEFKVVTSQDARPPAGAWDDNGRNLLPDLLAHRYVGNFELLPFKGFTKPHSLVLDLGEAYNGGPLRLLMHGEIEYFTATGMYAASQSGLEATAPYVEAQDANGKWHRVMDDMGFPAGLPRTITVDLGGKLPLGARRIRITTNLQIYWDSVLVDRSEQSRNVRLTNVPLVGSELRFHGYPKQIEDLPPGNVKYVYEQVSSTGPYARQAGTYTRYGDVKPLLTGTDDRFAVFGSGEEVALEFDPASLPVLPARWTRDYFFVANGYEKDMDFYAADGNTVEPLPFSRMGTYPYQGKAYPMDAEHLEYLLEYNTRFLSGNEPRGYAYRY
jgi:tetratricopeptide (TPR) repeat protein